MGFFLSGEIHIGMDGILAQWWNRLESELDSFLGFFLSGGIHIRLGGILFEWWNMLEGG